MQRVFRDYLFDLTSQNKGDQIKEKTGIDPGQLSNFKNEQRGGALTLIQIDKLCEAGNVVILTREQYESMKNTIMTITDFWKSAERNNGHDPH